MAEMKICPICGKLKKMNSFLGGSSRYSCDGRLIDVCSDCAVAIENVVSSSEKTRNAALRYLEDKWYAGCVSDEGHLLIQQWLLESLSEGRISKKDLDGWEIRDEEIEKAEKVLHIKSGGRGGMIICGVLFLLLAVILFFVSVDNPYAVANMQTTVFSAASMVAGVICLVGATVVSKVQTILISLESKGK